MASYSYSKVRINAPGSNPPYRRDTGPRHPSLDLSTVPPVDNSALRVRQYDGELLARERAAQDEIAYKKSCVAPLFNKGAYQFITPETDPHTIGRK